MTDEDKIILELTKENNRLKSEVGKLENEIRSVSMYMSSVGIPSGFEDGNDWDDYSFSERFSILKRYVTI